MTIKKYINTGELAELTGCLDEEIRELAKNGVLPAHKTRRGHWRFNVDAVEKHFGIQFNKPEEDSEEEVAKNKTHLIINEEHYEEVIQRICAAKKSIKIMTANFKRFKLKPTAKQGKNYNDGTPFIKFIMDKAAKGVSVQIICSNPSASFMEEWKDYYRQLGNPKLFEYKYCRRNHAKVYIVDDRIAYIGSANVTKAGIRQLSPENFEVGILTEDQEMLSSVKSLFSSVWNGDKCSNCPKVEECNKESRL